MTFSQDLLRLQADLSRLLPFEFRSFVRLIYRAVCVLSGASNLGSVDDRLGSVGALLPSLDPEDHLWRLVVMGSATSLPLETRVAVGTSMHLGIPFLVRRLRLPVSLISMLKVT